MRGKFTLLTFLFVVFTAFGFTNNTDTLNSKELYKEIGLEKEIEFNVFDKALKGYEKIGDKKKNLLTIIDFTKPSTEERFYVVDMSQKKVLVKSVVSHGKNSGGNMATSFSNTMGSYKSSLGFYLTEETYFGKNGYSLNLEGLEKGINDKARERRIVVHGADYANPSVAKSQGRLGRSLGCPALPKNITKSTIDTIKDGSVMFINGADSTYESKSEYI